jgi:hypothetical protein
MLIGIVKNIKKEDSLVQELIRIENVSYDNQTQEISGILTRCIDEEVDEITKKLKDCLDDYDDYDGDLAKVIDNVQGAIYRVVQCRYETINNAAIIIEKLNLKEIVSNRYAITDDNRIYDRDTCFEVISWAEWSEVA